MADSDPSSTEAELATALMEGLQALRAGHLDEAIGRLTAVCDHPDLAQADDMDDVRARAHSLLAQGLLEAGRHEEALVRLEVSQRLVRDLGDTAAMQPLAELGARIRARAAQSATDAEQQERARRLAAMDVSEIEARVRSERALVEVLVRKANADADAGRAADASRIAQRALQGAISQADPRLEVLARLSIARADPAQAEEQVQLAHACADAASEPGLITAIAKAATLHGVTLAPEPEGGKPL